MNHSYTVKQFLKEMDKLVVKHLKDGFQLTDCMIGIDPKARVPVMGIMVVLQMLEPETCDKYIKKWTKLEVSKLF